MRQECFRTILAVALLATSMIGTSVKAATSPQPEQGNSTNKPETAKKPALHHPARSKYRKTAHKNDAKRNDYRPDYKQNAVEVMNGSSTSRVVFDDEKNAAEAAKADPSQLKVEVVNGNSTDTRYFHLDGNAQQTEAVMTKQPVVVGIESSDTRFAGGNKNPVVTGITAAGQDDATKVRGGGQKLTNGVSPQPKRPPYEPDVH